MSTLWLIVIAQVAIIALASASFFLVFKNRKGPTRAGKIVFFPSAIILIVAVGHRANLEGQASERTETMIRELHQITVMSMKEGPERALPASASEAIRIDQPKGGSTVEAQEITSGHVSAQVSSVWVVIHPVGTSAYWVQPAVAKARTGEWLVTVYFGRSGSIDVGKSFEIVAIGDPAMALREQQIFDRWPDARFVSKPVVVVRK